MFQPGRMLLLVSVALFTTFFLPSCKLYAPVFRTVDNMKAEKSGVQGVAVSADAVFYNPNRVRVKVSDIALDVMVDKKQLATIGRKEVMLIKRKSEFRLPLALEIKPDGDLLSYLQTAIGIYTNKEALLTFTGRVKVKWLCLKREVPIRFEQRINLSQLR